MNLLESYKNRLVVSESVYSKQHNGEKMDQHRKLVVANCLKNVSSFLNEAFNSSTGATQQADLGLWKKFCLNLTTVALPNLIANDLVIVHPMSSMSGFITYIQYVAGKDKGQTHNGDVFNSPFALGDVNPNYTGDRVVENFTAASTPAAYTPVWNQGLGTGTWTYNNTNYDFKVLVYSTTDASYNSAPTAISYGNFVDGQVPTSGWTAGEVGSATGMVANTRYKVAYKYDNIVVPQNDIPTLKAEMKSISLVAKARRIAVFYSQIAAFQAKTDYGFDLGDQLAEKSVGQLSYEIDTEVVGLLDTTAGDAQASLTWSKTLPVGVSKSEHYEGFAEMIEIGRQVIYDRTKRFAPNYMIIASNVLPILTFMKGWSAAPAGQINGPYFAGTLNSLKVYVSPAIAPGRYLIGVNGDDMMSSVAVYAPYMTIVPTQLLQYADGGTTQGFSTMYDLQVLNDNLIVAGAVVD